MDRIAKILIVDDDQATLKMLSTLVANEGYSFETALDGPEALGKAKAANPDIILLDIIMPGMDGIETCRRLKSDPGTRHIPVIILTAMGDNDSKIGALKAGASDFLSKPVDPADLVVRIKIHLQLREVEDSRKKNEVLRTTISVIETARKEWETTMDSIGDAVILIDEKDHIVRCNKIVTTLTGKPYRELLDRKWQDVLDECGCSRLLNDSGDIEIYHPNGKWFNFNINYTKNQDDKSKYAAVLTLQDITERKKMEDLLIQSKQDWEDVFNTITDMVTLHDSDFNIIRANRAAEKILNLPVLNVKRSKCYEGYHGTECPPAGCPSCECLKTGAPATFEVFEPHLNMFIEIRSLPRFDANRRLIGLIHVVRDITERKRMQDKILHQNEFLNNIIDSFGYPFYVIDVNDYSIKIANRAARKDGLTEGITCHELTHKSPVPCCDEEHPCPIEIVKKTKKPVTLEHIHYVDGLQKYVEVHGYPIFDSAGDLVQIIEYSMDITERKEAEELLRKSREELLTRHEALAEATEALEITNLQIDKDKRDLQFALDEISFFLNQVADEKDFSIRFSNLGSDVSDHAYKIGELFNNMMHILESQHKELEKAYEEIKATQSHILQQEKMASIGQLAAGVAHEINNPMGFIMSNLSSLNKYADKLSSFIKAQSDALERLSKKAGVCSPEFEETERGLKECRRALKIDYVLEDLNGLIKESLDGADRVKKIVQDLKSFSRIDEAENKMADINDGLNSTINIVWNELKYKVTLKKEYGNIPMTKCNPGQLNQVFMNMLVNSAHAIEKQGGITVKTWSDSGHIYVSIADTGCGIPPDKINRIFEPFFTTKDVGKGTGLGLSIAYDIIKKHKGEISVESEVDKGTTFTIKIPVVEN